MQGLLPSNNVLSIVVAAVDAVLCFVIAVFAVVGAHRPQRVGAHRPQRLSGAHRPRQAVVTNDSNSVVQ